MSVNQTQQYKAEQSKEGTLPVAFIGGNYDAKPENRVAPVLCDNAIPNSGGLLPELDNPIAISLIAPHRAKNIYTFCRNTFHPIRIHEFSNRYDQIYVIKPMHIDAWFCLQRRVACRNSPDSIRAVKATTVTSIHIRSTSFFASVLKQIESQAEEYHENSP